MNFCLIQSQICSKCCQTDKEHLLLNETTKYFVRYAFSLNYYGKIVTIKLLLKICQIIIFTHYIIFIIYNTIIIVFARVLIALAIYQLGPIFFSNMFFYQKQ